jgi:enoyl-CoA hydratase/carnithine racemase
MDIKGIPYLTPTPHPSPPSTNHHPSNQPPLLERASLQKAHTEDEITRLTVYPPSGFGGFTSRIGKKPVIAAVNGHAHGGGFEIALNSDIVLASSSATFRLPDVSRGTAAMLGAFPRLLYHVGLQRAMLMALTAYTLGPEEAKEWGIVLKVVPGEKLMEEAVGIAKVIAGMSPDSIIVSRSGVRLGLEMAGVERATQITKDVYGKRLMEGENVREGLRAFLEKREARWVPSKL